MRDKTAVFYFAAFIVFVSLMILLVDISPKKLLSSAGIGFAGADASLAARINERYRREFDFQAAAKTAGAYLPVYSKLSANDAAGYASRFGIYSSPAESENEFIFSGDGFTIAVDKYLSRVRYDAGSNTSGEKITANEALLAVKAFMFSSFGAEPDLTLSNEDEYGFLFTEYRTLDGLPFDGFSSSALVASSGEIIYCENYLTEFEKIGARALLSLEEACLKLPLPEDGDNRKITIKKTELRYAFLNSIVQPVYVFEGKYPDEANFRVIVPALKYD